MTREHWQAGMTLAATISLVAGLLYAGPFRGARGALTGLFRAGPEAAKIDSMYRDGSTQEVSNGEAPLKSLREVLSASWRGRDRSERAVLIGNSQTFSVILAPTEKPTGGTEKTYSDYVFEHYTQAPRRVAGYRLAAPNISYMEALWYLRFLTVHPELTPGRLVLQLNYETFRKSGVRDGMLELLSDERFAQAIRAEAVGSAPHAATFALALQRFAEMQQQSGARGGDGARSAPAVTKTGITQSAGFGNWIEKATRAKLERIPGIRVRHELKQEFLDVLYLLRVNVLGIRPTTKRSIGGASLAVNLSALGAIGSLCQQEGIELVLFNAPQNPLAPLYRTAEDRELYQRIMRETAAKYGARLYDFETSIPGECWGVWIDGPDPIHFGREGHKRMAKLVIESGMMGPRS